MKKADRADIVTEGSSGGSAAQNVLDGSGKAVNDAAQGCVSTGHSAPGSAADCGVGTVATAATVNAPAPAISEPVAAVAVPAQEPMAQATPTAKPEITKGEVVTAAPKLEELSLQAEAVFKFGKSDSASLLPAAKSRLDELAARIAQLGAQAVSKITVTGHADRLGLDAANQSLSRQRAETVQRYLASKGVPAALLQVGAKGESAPIVQCKGDKPTVKLKACLAPNRRVEVVVYGQ
jgi:outer membrane protein OmpA-like peptidoglycan-associated protein